MDFLTERKELVEYGKMILDNGLTKGTGGNLSIRAKKKDLMLITPTGIPYHQIKSEDIVLMDLNGNVLEGSKKPSSEYGMHSILYKNRDDIDAVLHTHTTYAAALSCLNIDLPAIHYLVATGGGKDVRCAKYATFGTSELAQNALEAMQNRYACLLANHGMLVGARDMPNAINITEEIEFCCELYLRTLACGKPVILPDEEMERMLVKFKVYGQVNG